MNDLVITFPSSNHAIAAEYICKSAGMEMELIPTPREISSNCGFSLLIYRNDPKKIRQILEKEDIPFAKIFIIQQPNGEKYYEEIN